MTWISQLWGCLVIRPQELKSVFMHSQQLRVFHWMCKRCLRVFGWRREEEEHAADQIPTSSVTVPSMAVYAVCPTEYRSLAFDLPLAASV